MIRRMLIAAIAVAAAGGVFAEAITSGGAAAKSTPPDAFASDPIGAVIAAEATPRCDVAEGFELAGADNAASLTRMSWSPFGRAERGWEIYGPMIAAEIGSPCEFGSPGFARDLAKWQGGRGLKADGRMAAGTFAVMKDSWQSARTYVGLRASGVCPAPPASTQLVSLDVSEGYKGKAIQLQADAAEAYRRMVAAARAEAPEIALNPEALQIYSGYRSPSYDDARCARDGNCGGITRAQCSSHRTGHTFDLVVTPAPGHGVDSTNDVNRLAMSRAPEYRWLVENAHRFGFVNYVFEPWHWEYVGKAETQMIASAVTN